MYGCVLDFSEVQNVRQQIPSFKHRRTDLYDTQGKQKKL